MWPPRNNDRGQHSPSGPFGWFSRPSVSIRRAGRRRCPSPAKFGCTPQTLNDWGKRAEGDSGRRAGVPTEMSERMKAPERENRELRPANEILRKSSAYCAMAEPDRRSK